MTRLPELHRQLVLAARREEERRERLGLLWRITPRKGSGRRAVRLAGAPDARRPGGPAARRRPLARRPGGSAPRRGPRAVDVRRPLAVDVRRTRLALVSLAVLLSTATIALAASGVLVVGSSVPGADLHPASGVGVPVAARLLPLRVADPAGGLPWGMRIVRTSRQLVCLQVGRVEHGVLGELGIDGAFDDDSEFHPLPADALPNGGDALGLSDVTVDCALSGHATMAAKVAIPTSAYAQVAMGSAARRSLDALPDTALRDVYFGALGPRAVSVTYREGDTERSQRVVSGVGAYLMVLPATAGQPRESGSSTSGTGLLSPGPEEPLRKVTYRVGGRLCEAGLAYTRGRGGAWSPHGSARDVAHPCGAGERRPSRRPGLRRLRREIPLHAHVEIARGVVTGLRVSFRAPYAVTGAQRRYAILLPRTRCDGKHEPGELGGTGFSLNRDVRRGALVSTFIAYPFRVAHSCGGRTVTIDVLYSDERPGATLVATATIEQPPGTRNGSLGRRRGAEFAPRRASVPPPRLAGR